ncbi:MAG: DUF190 domain-containing protein [Armatimonadota bacterium]
MNYSTIEIFTNEEARYKGKPVWEAIIERIKSLKIAARVGVYKGIAGCTENDDISINSIEVLSYNMPVKIEIILPSTQLSIVLPILNSLVSNGIISTQEVDVTIHRTEKRLILSQIKVMDVMTKSPVSISPDATAEKIIRLLLSSKFNALPVVDINNNPIGIITQSDLISKGAMPMRLGLLALMNPEKRDIHLTDIPFNASDLMTIPAITVNQNEPLNAVVDIMLKKEIKHVPVIRDDGTLVGMIARYDIFRTITAENPDWDAIHSQCSMIDVSNAVYVRDIMRRDTHSVLLDTPVEEVMKVIDQNDIQRVAVVDDEGHLKGLISDSDLLKLFADQHESLWDMLIHRSSFTGIAQISKTMTASEVMKADLITVNEETPIEDAIRIMTDHSIKRLPVVDGKGIFKGMVSRDSVLRAGTSAC